MMQHLLSDEAPLPGLLFAIGFDGQGRARQIDVEADLPSLAASDEGFVWLHIDLIDARVDGLIAAGRLGPERLAAATFARDEHQRVAIEGAHAGLVLADRERAFDGAVGEEPKGRLHCLLGPRLVVTGRRHATACAEAARDAALAGALTSSPARLLERLVGGVVEALDASAVRLSDALDAVEDRILEGSASDDDAALAPIRGQAVRLHRHLAGLSAVFHRLEAETETEEDALPEAMAAMAARMTQRLDSIDRDMVALSERSRLMQDEIAGRATARTNRQLFTLSILTALFLPPTLVTGVFGMNTKGLFLGDFENGSTIALACCGLSALAVYLVIRRLGLAKPRG